MDRTERDASPQPAAASRVAESQAAFEGAQPVLRTRAPSGHKPDWAAISADTRRRFPKTLARLAE